MEKARLKTFSLCFQTLIIQPLNPTLYAQENANQLKSYSYYLNAGVGGSWLAPNQGAISTGVSVCYFDGKNLYSIRYVRNLELKLNRGSCPSEEGVLDIGLMYGRASKSSYGVASASAGLGLVHGSRCAWDYSTGQNRYTDERFYTVGIPVEIQLSWTPTSFFGLGIIAFADLNLQQSFAGGLLSITFGSIN
ncbi:MAG: hypothetical protein A2X67_11725 [Ignavibacteria bacterium GWA2_55_11]|nr:MAG: hypothetical protein A2X67_11725 [Ignavibacteria bacterium GWA2_55_11]OGU72043.1 MAG: hypothetical protein A3G43_09070 [Ignavibacteria bacterium RIFCSPLOWO2_12_FULL_56_21]